LNALVLLSLLTDPAAPFESLISVVGFRVYVIEVLHGRTKCGATGKVKDVNAVFITVAVEPGNFYNGNLGAGPFF
jgi:hypothetical protein